MNTLKYITCAAVCLLAACTNPVQSDILEERIELQSTKTEQEEIMELQAVKEFPMYWVADSGTIWGIPADYPASAPEQVVVKDAGGKKVKVEDFFGIDMELYIKVSEQVQSTDADGNPTSETVYHYFEQYNGNITEMAEDDFPTKPESDFFTGTFEGFEVGTMKYDTTTISVVSTDFEPAGDERFRMVDNAIRGESGLFISVIDGRTGREPGLWYWTYGKTTLQHMKEKGRLW